MVSLLPTSRDIETVLSDEVIETAIEDRYEEEGKEDHENKVADKNVIPAVAHVSPHLGGADWEMALLHNSEVLSVMAVQVIQHFCVIYFVTSS